MANSVGVQILRSTVGPMSFGPDSGDSFLVALTAERGPADVPTLVSSMSRFRAMFGGPTPFEDGVRYSDGYEVLRSYFSKGGNTAWVLRIVGDTADTAHVDIEDRQTTEPDDTLRITASGPGSWAADYDVEILDGTRDGTFKLQIINILDVVVEEFDNLRMIDSSLDTVSSQSQYVDLEDLGSEALNSEDVLPAVGTYGLDDTQSGADDNEPDDTTIIGEQLPDGSKVGLKAFDKGRFGRGFIVAPGLDEGAMRTTVGDELTQNGQDHFRIYLTCADEGTTVNNISSQREEYDAYNVGFYYVRPVTNDDYSEERKTFSPVGHIVADYQQAIAEKGPGKAPAGSDFRINHVDGVEARQNGSTLVDEGIAEQLLAQNINPIWDRDRTGPKVWGARAATSDPDWRFLHVAYLYNLIASRAQSALDSKTYENASEDMFFSEIRLGIRQFMVNLHDNGAFHGIIPEDQAEPEPEHAFNLQADESLMSPQDKEDGTPRARIEFVPAITAERISVEVAKRNHQ